MIVFTPRSTRHLLSIALLGSLLLASGCRAPLPKLQSYGTAPNGDWTVDDRDDLGSALDTLDDHHDQGVRDQARQVRASITRLEEDRSRKIADLKDVHEADNDLLAEVIRVEVDFSRLPGRETPEQLREQMYLQAIEAEEAGQLALAIEYASIASAIELYTPELADDLDHEELATTLQRRLSRRFYLLRIAAPELARRLVDEAYQPESDEVSGFDGGAEVSTGLGNASALMDLMHRKHVDDPELAELHRAGLDEVLAVCELLALHDTPGARQMLDRVRAESLDPDSARTMSIVMALNRIQETCPDTTAPEHFLARVFVEGAAGALDKRTTIIWPDEHARYLRNFGRQYRGLGAKIDSIQGGGIEIKPIPGGPAARAGIRSGDVLEQVDGVPVEHLSVDELTMITTDPERETIELSLERKDDGSPYSVEVVLGSVLVPHVTGWTQSGMQEDGSPAWNWLADREARIAYIRLDGFRPNGDRAIRLALQKAQQQAEAAGGRLEGLVLDLRMNPGGQVDIAEEVANMFLSKGTIFRSTDGRKRLENETAKNAHSELSGMPLIILVDERSASASELVSGLLQVRADALVIGDRTYGKGSIQSPMRALTDDCMAVVTTGWYLLPERGAAEDDQWRYVDREKNREGWGVVPDIEIPMSFEETADALDHRGRWYSGVDRDRLPDEDEAREAPADPASEMALAILRARILDQFTDGISAPLEPLPSVN